MRASDEDMQRIREALRQGKRVEIDKHRGAGIGGDYAAAREAATQQNQENAQGGHVARVKHDDGTRSFELGVDLAQTRELLDAGAVFLPPDSMRP